MKEPIQRKINAILKNKAASFFIGAINIALTLGAIIGSMSSSDISMYFLSVEELSISTDLIKE